MTQVLRIIIQVFQLELEAQALQRRGEWLCATGVSHPFEPAVSRRKMVTRLKYTLLCLNPI